MVWELYQESSGKRTGGDVEQEPESVPGVFDFSDRSDLVHFLAPKDLGAYRLYLAVSGAGDSVATANFPFKVAAQYKSISLLLSPNSCCVSSSARVSLN